MAPPNKRQPLRKTVEEQQKTIEQLRKDGRDRDVRILRGAIADWSGDLIDELQPRVVAWKDGLWELHKAFTNAHDKYKAALELHKKQLEAQRDLVFGALSFAAGSGIGWLGFRVLKNAKASKAIVGDVQEHFVGNATDALKGVAGWGVDKGKNFVPTGSIDVSASPLALLRSVLEHVDKTVVSLTKEFNKAREALEGEDPLVDDTLVRARLEKHGWDYNSAARSARAELRRSMERLTAKYLKEDPDPPKRVDMERRFERALWAYWFTSNFEVEKIGNHGSITTGGSITRAVEDRLIALNVVRPFKPDYSWQVAGNDQEVHAKAKAYVEKNGGTWNARRAKIANPSWMAPGGWDPQSVAIVKWAKTYLQSRNSDKRIDFLPVSKESAQGTRQLRSTQAHAQRTALKAATAIGKVGRRAGVAAGHQPATSSIRNTR